MAYFTMSCVQKWTTCDVQSKTRDQAMYARARTWKQLQVRHRPPFWTINYYKKKPWHLQNVTSNLGSSFKWYSCKNKRVAIFTNDSLTTVFQILVQKQLISPDLVVCKLLRQTLGSNECCVLETFVPDTCTKVDESWSTNNSLDHHPEIF